VFHAGVLLVGGAALAVVIERLGLASMKDAIAGVGKWFAIIAAIDLVSATCDAFAIHAFVRGAAPVSYVRVFGAQLSGMAINRLTPGHSLGEPLKATLLARSAPAGLSVSAILSFNLCTVFVGVASIVIGVPITMLALDLSSEVELAVWIGTVLLAGIAVALALLVRRGVVGTLVEVLAALRAISRARADRWRGQTDPIDARLRGLLDGSIPGLGRGLAGVIGSRCFNWLGTIALLHAADIPMTPAIVIASLSVGILVTWMSNVIPLGLGLADATNFALYGLLGATAAAGLVFTMVNRVRTVLLAAIGLTALAVVTFVHRRTS
jgi:hypothetical protein